MGRGRCFSIPKDEISLLEIRSKIERQGVLRGEKREFLSFFCFLAWRRALRARVQCVCSLPSKLAITPPLPSKLRFILRHKFITSAAVLTLICGCANREVFIARPLGLRHIGVRASALHFDPALGTKRRETRVSLFFCYGMYGWQKREHEVFRKEEAHAP